MRSNSRFTEEWIYSTIKTVNDNFRTNNGILLTTRRPSRRSSTSRRPGSVLRDMDKFLGRCVPRCRKIWEKKLTKYIDEIFAVCSGGGFSLIRWGGKGSVARGNGWGRGSYYLCFYLTLFDLLLSVKCYVQKLISLKDYILHPLVLGKWHKHHTSDVSSNSSEFHS